MRAVVLISHGALAQGIVDSFEMLCGRSDRLYAVCLACNDGPDDFSRKLQALEDTLSGYDEVLVLADVTGGTPCKAALGEYLAKPHVHIISGMNLPMVMEAVLGDSTPEALPELAKASIVNIKALVISMASGNTDE